MELYPHNRAAYAVALSMMEQSGRAAVIHPTGTGKSFIGFALAKAHPHARLCWLSPSRHIFDTQTENLKRSGTEAVPDNISFITYAKLIAMEAEEIAALRPDYIVLDEFHRCGAAEWSKGVERLLDAFPQAKVLGLSATNVRYLDNRRDMADELFDGNIASEMTLGEAIARNILNAPTYIVSIYSYKEELKKYQRRIDRLKNPGLRASNQAILDALRRTLEQAEGLDDMFARHIREKDGKYIVFCASVEHLHAMQGHVNEWFAKVDKEPHIYTVYAEDSASARSFAAFREDSSEHLKLLFCVDMLNEGVHVEGVNGVILLRPTVSPIIYKQQVGRALSASRSTEPVIFDVVNNFDNLYSIGTVQEEMELAAAYYRDLGEGEKVVNGSFRIIDEAKESRTLFEQLHSSLNATWEIYFLAAKAYFEEHGHLDVPKRYRTKDGLTLGAWLCTQRRVRAGTALGVLTEAQIEKLNAIGMCWDNMLEQRWEESFRYAQAYHKQYGNLDVPAKYISPEGFALGNWIVNTRQQRKSGIRMGVLTPERIARLDKLGMIWDRLDYQWEKNYLAAAAYYLEHGDLLVPADYVTAEGMRLGDWISGLRRARESASKGAELSEQRIARLDEIGMVWDGRCQTRWNRYYTAAREYYSKHGHLDMPVNYITENGLSLGSWLERQKDAYTRPEKTNCRINEEQIKKLNALGIQWERPDAWELRYALAKAYYEENGHLNVPASYTAPSGLALGKWIHLQRKIFKGKVAGKSLSEEQITRLEAIGMRWNVGVDEAWERNYAACQAYFDKHGHLNVAPGYIDPDGIRLGRFLQRFRSYKTTRAKCLSTERIALLDALGMVWGPESANADKPCAS